MERVFGSFIISYKTVASLLKVSELVNAIRNVLSILKSESFGLKMVNRYR